MKRFLEKFITIPDYWISLSKILMLFAFQKEGITACEDRVKKLLIVTPPDGKEFLKSVEHILEREKNWVTLFCLP